MKGDKGDPGTGLTTAQENKLNGIAAGAEVNVQADWNATTGDAFIRNKPTIPARRVLTQAQYDAITTKDANTMYLVSG